MGMVMQNLKIRKRKLPTVMENLKKKSLRTGMDMEILSQRKKKSMGMETLKLQPSEHGGDSPMNQFLKNEVANFRKCFAKKRRNGKKNLRLHETVGLSHGTRSGKDGTKVMKLHFLAFFESEIALLSRVFLNF